MPRKTDSRKNANTPSIASVWPITPPAKFENWAQFVPNWNSIGIPVTTPKAKLTAKIFVQKRAAPSAVARSASVLRSGPNRWPSRPAYDTVLK
jgi:hypothetical protein